MPTYEYRCPDGHVFEVFKSISAPAPDACAVCGKSPVTVVLHPVAVHFKGSGFYATDYGRGAKRKEGAPGGGKDAAGGETKTESASAGDSGGAEKKKAAEA